MRALCTTYQYSPRVPRRAGNSLVGKPLTEALKSVYQAAYFESGHIETHTGIQGDKGVKIVKYKDLQDTEVDGYPYAVDRDEHGDLQFHFPVAVANAHELIIGATGSGKTTSLVEPRIRALSTKKNKASLFISDPKGEIFQRHADYLERQGYRVYLLNFKDPAYSNTWNPLWEIFDVWMRQAELKKSFKQVRGWEHLAKFELLDDPGAFSETFWVCGGKAFASEKAARRWCEDQTAPILAETADLIHQLGHALIPDSMLGSHDPSWMFGARDILTGLIYLMLEDAQDKSRTGFEKTYMNLMNLQEYFERIRSTVVTPNGNIALLQSKKLAHKSDRDISIKILRSYLENAVSTTKSYIGVYKNALQEWFSPKIFTICSENNIDLDMKSGPVAIFLITRDSERSDFAIAGMFIDWIYRKLLEQADQNGGKLEREFFFILDEFVNIPKIKDFTCKITAARSRKISFHMILQSYAQLDEVYGPNAARTIADNCDVVFLGSKNFETKARFAKECGKQTVPHLDSVLNPVVDRMVEIPMITVSRLEELRQGQMYLRRAGMPLLLTRYEPCYRCSELTSERAATPEEMGIKAPSYNSDRFRYGYLESDQTMAEYSRIINPPKQQVEIEPEFLMDFIKL